MIIVLLASCKEDVVIGEQIIDQKFLIATDSNTPELVYYDYKNGLISNDIFLEKNQRKLPGKVTKIKEWGGLLYLVIPDKMLIEVIKKDDFTSVATIDYTSYNLAPTDICFTNPTDAYVCHGNDSVVSLLDIYNMYIDQIIKVGANPVSVASVGNQIFIANQMSNTVNCIDSRTVGVIFNKSLDTAPSLVDASEDSTQAIVITLGNGKIDSKTKSASKLYIFDRETKNILNEFELGTLKTSAVEQHPIKMIVTEKNYAFVLTKTHLLRINLEKIGTINTLKDDPFKEMIYLKLRNQIILVSESNEILVCNGTSASKVYSFYPNKLIYTVHPL
jgi:DNA-binding beta-propeller fold protein YncE